MPMVSELPGLRPLKRHFAIQAQDAFRSLPPERRGCISLAEIVRRLVVAGIFRHLDEATWFVVDALERGELADGSAQLIHAGRVQDFSPEDLRPVKTRGMWFDAEQLMEDLLQFIYVPLDAAEQWHALQGWQCDGHQLLPLPVVPGATTTSNAPAPSLPKSNTRPTLNDENAECFLKDRVANWPDSEPAPKFEVDAAAIDDHFGVAVPRGTVRRWRGDYTPLEWHKPGPRRPWGEVRQKSPNPPKRN